MLYKGKYRVESARLKGWDYTSPGWYFVTICTQDQACVLGDVVDGRVKLAPAGLIAQQCLLRMPKASGHVWLDASVVMPNHIHGIFVIGADESHKMRPQSGLPARLLPNAGSKARLMSAISPEQGSLPAIIRSYKAAVSRRCKKLGIADFSWQGRYYDHIIRDDRELANIRSYITNNPLQWQEDRLHPGNKHW